MFNRLTRLLTLTLPRESEQWPDKLELLKPMASEEENMLKACWIILTSILEIKESWLRDALLLP